MSLWDFTRDVRAFTLSKGLSSHSYSSSRLLCSNASYFANWCRGHLLFTVIKIPMMVPWEDIVQLCVSCFYQDSFSFINGTTAMVIMGKRRHWNYCVIKICHGFRIACETRYSLTQGRTLPYGISLNNDIFAWSSLSCFSLSISLISDTVLNSSIPNENSKVCQGLLYEWRL